MLKIHAIGNLTHDVELRTNPRSSNPMIQFQIACTRAYRDETGVHPADFICVKAHGKLAEQCADWLGKGSSIAVNGDLETFPDRDPEQRNFRIIIKAESIQFLSPRKSKSSDAAALAGDGLCDADALPGEDAAEVC